MSRIDEIRPYFNRYVSGKISIKEICLKIGATNETVSKMIGRLIKEMQANNVRIKANIIDSCEVSDVLNEKKVKVKKDFTVGDWGEMSLAERKKYY